MNTVSTSYTWIFLAVDVDMCGTTAPTFLPKCTKYFFKTMRTHASAACFWLDHKEPARQIHTTKYQVHTFQPSAVTCKLPAPLSTPNELFALITSTVYCHHHLWSCDRSVLPPVAHMSPKKQFASHAPIADEAAPCHDH